MNKNIDNVKNGKISMWYTGVINIFDMAVRCPILRLKHVSSLIH